jgi:hypothetical protein
MRYAGSCFRFSWVTGLVIGIAVVVLGGCTQEWQNTISRSIQNWTGTDGVLDVLSEGKVMYRFIKIDKLSTASATGDSSTARAYRFGYGVFDKNMNFIVDSDEKRVYFEVSDYSTSYLFYENPY